MITDLIAHTETTRLDLEAAYHQAKADERAAWQADEQRPYLAEHHLCSIAYTRAWGALMETWANWRTACGNGGKNG